jgi:hypothetical protein
LQTAELIPDCTALRPHASKLQMFHIKIDKHAALRPQRILLGLSTHAAGFGSSDRPEALNKCRSKLRIKRLN